MSKIQKELLTATEIKAQKDGEDRQDFLGRVIAAVSDLDDKAWKELSKDAKDWFNAAADAVNDGKQVEDFADAEPPATKEEPGRRAVSRRGGEEAAPKDDPAVGDAVEITTKRGAVKKGEITEMDDDVIVLDGDDEIDRDRIESIVVTKAAGKASKADKAAPQDSGDPEVGDTVEILSKRGKRYAGKVVSIEQGLLVIDDGEGEEELDLDRMEKVTVLSRGKTVSKSKEEPKAEARRGSAQKDGDGDSKPKRTTAKDNGGVSATNRARELVAEDFEATADDVIKLMKKEKLGFKDSTVLLIWRDCHKFLGMLSEAGKLKGSYKPHKSED